MTRENPSLILETSKSCNLVVALRGRIGKPVRIRYGPAAVIGDESRCLVIRNIISR